MSRRRIRAFTLIEVMVVVAILAVLAALIVPRIMSRPDEARVVAARQDIGSILQALKLYRLDNLRYPSTEQGLAALGARRVNVLVRDDSDGGHAFWSAAGYEQTPSRQFGKNLRD